MTACLFAIGKQGVRSCQALLDAAMAGVVEAQDLQMILIGAEERDAEALQHLIHDYEAVRGRLVQSGLPGFACQIALDTVPEEGLDASLQERCETEADRLLMNCLFARDRLLRRSAASSLETAQAAWADFLEEGGPEQIRSWMERLGEGDLALVCGSLTETLFAGGCTQLLRLIREKSPAVLGTVLALPTRRSDRTDLAQSVLKDMPELDAVYMYGLSDDLRTEGDGMNELVALRCMEHFLSGGRGLYTFAQSMDVPTWALFGSRESEYQHHVTAFLHLSLMTLLRYGPDAMERLERSGTGYMRGWFGKVYGQIRRNPDRTSEERVYLRALLHLMRFHTAWCYLVTGNLPLPLRYQAQLQETEKKAAQHYQEVLNTAGKLALLSHDLEKSGILEERTVHRASMEDTEGEAARRKMVEMADHLQELADEQAQMEKVMGGRSTFMLLQAKQEEAEKEAEHLRQQEAEAERRIEEAAQSASLEDRPKIDAARSRLHNLQRHLVFLEGRAARARKDTEKARLEDNRNRKPQVEYTEENEPNVLFDRRLLKQAIKVYDASGSDRYREAERMLEAVQQPDLLRVCDRFERLGQELDGTSDMMAALYELWDQEYSGR